MKNVILAVALAALTLPAFADTTIDGKISSLGLGAEVAFPMTQSVDARIGLNGFQFTRTTSTAASPGVVASNSNNSFNLQSLQALADWHPWQSSFRLSGGLMLNYNKLNVTSTLAAGQNYIYLNGQKYNLQSIVGQDATVNATVDFRKVAPYLGIGWGRTPKNTGLSFTSDFGIMFQGAPRSNLTTNITNLLNANDITQANAQLRDSVKNYNMYPVISFGIGYSF